jgi:hypothetical protein
MTLERDPSTGRVRRNKTVPASNVMQPLPIPTPAIKPVETSSIVPVSGQSFTGLDPFTKNLLESSPVIPVVAAPVVSDSPVVAAPVVPVVVPPAPPSRSNSLLFGLAALAVGVLAVVVGRNSSVRVAPSRDFTTRAPEPVVIVPQGAGWKS